MSLHDVFLSLQSRYANRPLSDLILERSLTLFSRPASSYWRFPLAAAKDRGRALTGRSESINWLQRPRSPDPSEPSPSGQNRVICEVLFTNDLYQILGVPRSPAIDRLTLRRAYLSRSRACHPEYASFLPFSLVLKRTRSKCPGNPDATHAFQRVSVAYGVLSQPSLKRMYDARPSDDQSDFLRSHPCGYADETLKGVLLSIMNDYLDGNFEMIRTLLRKYTPSTRTTVDSSLTSASPTFSEAVSDLNPSLKLSNDGIDSVLSCLENIRGRVLSKSHTAFLRPFTQLGSDPTTDPLKLVAPASSPYTLNSSACSNSNTPFVDFPTSTSPAAPV